MKHTKKEIDKMKRLFFRQFDCYTVEYDEVWHFIPDRPHNVTYSAEEIFRYLYKSITGKEVKE